MRSPAACGSLASRWWRPRPARRPGCSAVLLDVRLPDILGTDVCRRLREGPSTGAIPIVHVSSLAPSEHGPDIGDFSGADAYLLSPVDVVFVASLIEDLLRERSRMS